MWLVLMNDHTTLLHACAAIEDVLPRFTELLRNNPDVTSKAVGTWTLPDVACHISHVIRTDTDALARRELPVVRLSPAGVAGWNASMLADDPERDLRALADRIDTLGDAFFDVRVNPPTEPITWLGGTRLPPSAVACHLLEELLVHGHDAANAAGMSWPIKPAHAALAIVGGVLPVVAASPQSWVRVSDDARVRARVEVRLRAFERFTLRLENGLRVESPPTQSRVDAHLSVDPATLLLVMPGRHSVWRAVRGGKVMAWGRRPQALLTLLRNTVLP
jgi:hypothetical protein